MNIPINPDIALTLARQRQQTVRTTFPRRPAGGRHPLTFAPSRVWSPRS